MDVFWSHRAQKGEALIRQLQADNAILEARAIKAETLAQDFKNALEVYDREAKKRIEALENEISRLRDGLQQFDPCDYCGTRTCEPCEDKLAFNSLLKPIR